MWPTFTIKQPSKLVCAEHWLTLLIPTLIKSRAERIAKRQRRHPHHQVEGIELLSKKIDLTTTVAHSFGAQNRVIFFIGCSPKVKHV